MVLWSRLVKDMENFSLQTAAFILMRLHSRIISESSSEVEEIIVSELTSLNKVLRRIFNDKCLIFRL